MSSADLATVVIACPHCGTRYQVPPATIGAAGREVQCAQCGKSWHAKAEKPAPAPPPPPAPAAPPEDDLDAMFSPADEAALDEAFEAEEEAAKPAAPPAPVDPDHARTLADIRAAIAPKPKAVSQPAVNTVDPAALKRAQSSFAARQKLFSRGLPTARVRRNLRIAAVGGLVALLGLGIGFRTDIVRALPSLAALYSAVGLGVNVVGLTFEDSKTISGLRDGKTMMQITARIRSVAGRTVRVPPVLVSLLDDKGTTLYEWTVSPKVAEMDPGEVMDFSTEVNSPPAGAVKVRLSFTTKA